MFRPGCRGPRMTDREGGKDMSTFSRRTAAAGNVQRRHGAPRFTHVQPCIIAFCSRTTPRAGERKPRGARERIL